MKKRYLLLVILIMTFHTGLRSGNIRVSGDKNAFVIQKSNDKELIFSNTVGDINYNTLTTREGNFIQMDIEGYSYSFKIGAPKLPVLRKLMEIPLGGQVQVNIMYSEIQEYKLSEFGIQYPVVPVQPPAIKSKPEGEFAMDKMIYGKNEFYRDNVAGITRLGIMRGYNLARLDIAPVQYGWSGVAAVYSLAACPGAIASSVSPSTFLKDDSGLLLAVEENDNVSIRRLAASSAINVPRPICREKLFVSISLL